MASATPAPVVPTNGQPIDAIPPLSSQSPDVPSTPRSGKSLKGTSGHGAFQYMATIGEAVETFHATQITSTPYGKSTQDRKPVGTTVEDVKDTLLAELGGVENIPVVDLEFTRSLYQKVVPDSKIKAFLRKKATGYKSTTSRKNGNNGRWRDIPTSPQEESEVYSTIVGIITAILGDESLVGPAIVGVTRSVVDTSNVFLHHSDQDPKTHSTRPDVSIVAEGPSFQVPLPEDALPSQRNLSVGYSNVTSVFDIKLHRKATMVKKHTSQLATYVRYEGKSRVSYRR